MVLDVCHPPGVGQDAAREAMERTHRWAERCLAAHSGPQLLFGIVQGGTSIELRLESARFLSSLPFPGIAVGGLSVGEPKATMWEVLGPTVQSLPARSPRYLMGVGSPEDVVRAVGMGVDMFDSVLPTRVARHGAVFTAEGRRNLRNASFREMLAPIDETCDCYTCRAFTVAYLHHLFKCEELLGYRLATVHNIRFMTRLMEAVRGAISDGTFQHWHESFLARYRPSDDEVRQEQRRKWRHRGLPEQGAAP